MARAWLSCRTGKGRWRTAAAAFRRNSGGAAAVEFAIVSIPFFALLFAILEMALSFFVSEILDVATETASRLIRTGQAYDNNMTSDQFKAQVCDGMANLVDCTDSLYVDVQQYDQFSSYQPVSPIDANGNLTTMHYTNGDTTQPIIVVRSFYKWPIFCNFLAYSGTMVDGDVLLGAVSAFRVEPFS